MSDLLSPILFVVQNEVDAFWCFCGFMELVVSTGWGGSVVLGQPLRHPVSSAVLCSAPTLLLFPAAWEL